MEVHLLKYKAPLNKDERSFLKKKEEKDRRQFFKVMQVLLVFCFVCPFAGAWIKALKGDALAFSYFYYFLGVAFLIVFSGAGAYISYRAFLYKLQQDIKQATKTIETTTITRKQFMPNNNTYYFYLSSSVKLSIEVSEEDYAARNTGDEISIEYTPFSKIYLGYQL
jgi:hypothetical protein